MENYKTPMNDIIKNLQAKKEEIAKKVTELKGQIWDLNLESKRLDKAISALTPKEETKPSGK